MRRILFGMLYGFPLLVGAADCSLTWASVTEADDYDLYHSTLGNDFVFAGTVATTSTTCSAVGIDPIDGDLIAVESSNTEGNSDKLVGTWHKPYIILDFEYE